MEKIKMPAVMTIPKGKTLKEVTVNGVSTTVLVSKQSRRSSFKTPKSVRDKISAASKRIRIPILTVAANALPALDLVSTVFTRGRSALSGNFVDQAAIVNTITRPYFGIEFGGDRSVTFKFERLLMGLVPNLAVLGINRLGIFRSTNQKLGKNKVTRFISIS